MFIRNISLKQYSLRIFETINSSIDKSKSNNNAENSYFLGYSLQAAQFRNKIDLYNFFIIVL